MNNREQDYKVRNANYFVIASIIVLLFILMMIITNLSYLMDKNSKASNTYAKSLKYSMEKEKQASIKSTCLVVTGKDKNNSIKIAEEGLDKANIGFIQKEKLGDITYNEASEADIVIINGSSFSSAGNVDMLLKFLQKGKHIIFTSMPDVQYINSSGLDKIMGIKSITVSKNEKGVKFLPGFMLGGLLEFKKLVYKAPQVQLLSTAKTYVTGPKASAVIWRNTYNESEIYVVNGPFFNTNAGYGILSAIMSQIYPDYIYPVVNAKVYTYTGLPYVSYENTDKLEKIYNRNAMQLQKDILIPDVLSITKSRNLIPSAFLTVGFGKNNSNAQINNYKDDISKLGEDTGMVYSGDLEKDTEAYKNLFNNNFDALRVKEQDFNSLEKVIDKEQFSSIQSVVGPWEPGRGSFGFINDNAVYIPFTADGAANSDAQQLQVYSGITAFGAVVQNLDLQKVVFPKDNEDNWIKVSRAYVKSIDSYREKFQMLEARNISDTAAAVKKFNLNCPTIQYSNNKIELNFEKWYGEAYYILRTSKEVAGITGGTIQSIEDGVFLVTVKDKEVNINLREIDKYQ